MKRMLLLFLIFAAAALTNVHAETETIDLKALAKKARPAVMLLVVSDAAGKEIATGTGFLVSSDGKLTTNHHVIEKGATAVAKSETGGKYSVVGVVADDAAHDVVLLQIEGKNFPYLTLGSTERVETGARIAVIGSPLGLEGSLSEGIVSARRDLPEKLHLLQITAAISPGSSGSPVLNGYGEVIGVASAQIVEGQSLNFAVPAEVVQGLLTQSASDRDSKKISSLPKKNRFKSFSEEIDYNRRINRIATAKERHDYSQALDELRYLLARNPDDASLLSSLGETYDLMTLHSDAVATFQKALKLDPENASLWFELGMAYVGLEEFAEASAACQRAVKLWPEYVEAWDMLATVYPALGKEQDAKAAAEQARKLKEGSVEISERSIKRDPDNDVAWARLTSLYQQQKQPTAESDRMKAFMSELIRLHPNNANVWTHLQIFSDAYGTAHISRTFTVVTPDGRTLEVESDHKPSEAEIDEVSKKLPDKATDAIPKFKLRPNDWMLMCENFLRTNPDNQYAWTSLKGVCGSYDYLLPFCREMTTAYPQCAPAWQTLGMIYQSRKKSEDAVPALERATKLNPRDPYAWQGLALAYTTLGQKERAAEALRQLEKLDATLWALAKAMCEKGVLDKNTLRNLLLPKESADKNQAGQN